MLNRSTWATSELYVILDRSTNFLTVETHTIKDTLDPGHGLKGASPDPYCRRNSVYWHLYDKYNRINIGIYCVNQVNVV